MSAHVLPIFCRHLIPRAARRLGALSQQRYRPTFSVTTVRDSIPAKSSGLRVNTGRSLATAVAVMIASYARALLWRPD